ncbi:glycosyltransferase family 2 protein [Cellulomonas palmilytica]|uniref:glycosyltransferase family 2 protein n=1 Tax=Cellulomonas palmilytica TaxID=2608402 RepID=UPI001F405860|nr:glycosyltransferase [Cellulomonas palmilytica]
MTETSQQLAEQDRTRALTVVVAVLTYRRPDDLAAVLESLRTQVGSVDDEVSVLVVDNDPDAGARETVVGPHVRYVHEPRPGIAAARNRALDEVGDADVLVFLDDDERPVEDWLAQLLATHRRTDACVVGPVVSRFEVEPDAWVRAGRFFDRRRLRTGTPVVVAATNNLLLDLPPVRASGVRFDEAFGLSGGSDTLFTRRLVAAGIPMVWCDEALVTDEVPAARATRAWVLHRASRSGNSATRCDVALASGAAGRTVARGRGIALGSARVLAGGVRALVGTLTRSPEHHARGLRTVARGRGMVTGAFGRVVYDYARGT